MVKLIELPEDVCTNLQKLHYECETLKDNIGFLITKNRNDVSFIESPLFKELLSRQIKKTIEYENAKDDMTQKFIPAGLVETESTWEVDFNKSILIVTVED